MIYCVVPRDFADQLYEPLADYYRDAPNVEVIVDRRSGEDRRKGRDDRQFKERREIRDRRRRRIPGTFPPVELPE